MDLIGEGIKEVSRVHPHKKAIVCGAKALTYQELQKQIDTLQGKLASLLGKGKGKRVGFLLPNEPDWLVVFIAISSAGGVAVPFDPKWTAANRKHVQEDADLDLFIYDERLIDPSDWSLEKSYPLEYLYRCPSAQLHEPVSDEEIFYIGYTSGTTGRPKGYMRSHASWADCFVMGADVFSLGEKDHILSPGPLVHSHFLYASVQAIHLGATLYIVPSFQTGEVWSLLAEKKISVLYIVPTMFEALKRNDYGQKKATCLKTMISSGAKWEKTSKQQAARLFSECRIYEFYGASELSFVSVQDVTASSLPDGAIGEPFPQVKWKILNEKRQKAEVGEIGTLYVKSPWIFKGYVNSPEQTEEMFAGEWATVGDLAYIDKSGHVILIGRKQNMIISGGLNIFPEEVEQAIQAHPAIEEAIVLGIPDSYWGEKVVSLYKKRRAVTDAELRTQCRKHLPGYKCPKEWIEVAEFIYTTSGKVARKSMKEWLQNKEEESHA